MAERLEDGTPETFALAELIIEQAEVTQDTGQLALKDGVDDAKTADLFSFTDEMVEDAARRRDFGLTISDEEEGARHAPRHPGRPHRG